MSNIGLPLTCCVTTTSKAIIEQLVVEWAGAYIFTSMTEWSVYRVSQGSITQRIFYRRFKPDKYTIRLVYLEMAIDGFECKSTPYRKHMLIVTSTNHSFCERWKGNKASRTYFHNSEPSSH